MKILKSQLIIAVVCFSNFISIHSMEVTAERYVFLTTAIRDIQNMAKDMSQETGLQYQIVTAPDLLKRCLQTLGLNFNNTPLDIRYHYDLLLQELSMSDPLRNIINKVYNQLIMMLFVFDGYQAELQELLTMSFQQVEAIELEGVTSKYQFLKHKGRVIEDVISMLKEGQQRYDLRKPFESVSAIHVFLGLPQNSSPDLVEKAYNVYMEKNSPHKLIALKTIKKKSGSYVKAKMLEVEKVKKAYEQYLKDK